MPQPKKADPEDTGEAQVEAEREAAEPEAPEPEAQDAKQSSESFTVARLIAEADAFLGVPSGLLAGALAGEDAETELTLTEARKRVESWSKAPQGPGE